MDAYEFTRFEADFSKKTKALSYDVDVVAFQIEYSNPGTDFRSDADYIEAKDVFIETTMSCDLQEAIQWAQYYMVKAIAYGCQTRNLDWMTKFLAAYDLFNNLTASSAR